jgi:NADH dehydrogenase
MERERRPRVVVVGAGFGGLRVVKGLRDAPVDVVLVDRENYHLFQPLLYQVATAALNSSDIAYPVRGILRRIPNATFRFGTVVGADWTTGELELDDSSRLAFDQLVVAAGAVTATFGVAGAGEHAFPLKALEDALVLRSHLLATYEAVATAPSRLDGGWLTFVVVGGGATGVETAGAFSELAREVLAQDFPDLDPGRVRVVLVEMTDHVLAPFHPRLREHAAEELRQRGVELRLGESVARVTPEAVELGGGERIATRTVVWAAGVRPHPVAAALGLPLADGGRVEVAADLSVPGRPGVWAIGDIAATPAPDGGLLPQVAQVAMQGGKHVAGEIRRRLDGEAPRPFRYRDRGSMATIGRRAAVAELPLSLRFTGTLGWLMWLFLHLLYLVGFRNRLSVLVDWAWTYVTWNPASRLILRSLHPDRSRTAG